MAQPTDNLTLLDLKQQLRQALRAEEEAVETIFEMQVVFAHIHALASRSVNAAIGNNQLSIATEIAVLANKYPTCFNPMAHGFPAPSHASGENVQADATS